MKYLKIFTIFFIILFFLTSITQANTSNEIVYNLVEDYLKSYQTQDTPNNLKLSSYKIEKVDIIEETENEIIAFFSANIEPESQNYNWSTTYLTYYIRVEKKDDTWEITEMATSPLELSTYTSDDTSARSIVYNLVNEYLSTLKESSTSDTEKIKYYEISNIEILSENNDEISTSVTINIVPYNKEISVSNIETKVLNFTAKKINDEWKLYNDSGVNLEEKYSNSNTQLSYNDTIQDNKNIKFIIPIVIFILIVIVFLVLKFKKSKNRSK